MAGGDIPSMAAAVAIKGRIVWEAAAGWADRERQIQATPHTPYSLASVSKPFTATAVMILVERGLLQLDRPANDYLDGAQLTGEHAARATVRHLLAHTAGLPPYFRPRPAQEGGSFESTIAARGVVERRPGRRYVYSNLGYGILDHIVGKVSGQAYAEFLRREIAEPLALARTFVPSSAPHDAATRYGPDGAALPFYDVDHRGASSVYASVHDLVRFGIFHLSGSDGAETADASRRVLGRDSLREMQRVQTWIHEGVGYGLGWRVEDDQRGFRHVGHTGGMPGVTAVLSLFPAQDVVVAVVSNTRDDRVLDLARRLAFAAVPTYAWQRRARE